MKYFKKRLYWWDSFGKDLFVELVCILILEVSDIVGFEELRKFLSFILA